MATADVFTCRCSYHQTAQPDLYAAPLISVMPVIHDSGARHDHLGMCVVQSA